MERHEEPLSEPRSFEEQFADKEILEVLGGDIEVVDIQPQTAKTERPVLFAPGWGETPETFKDALRIMAERGRRVISLSNARHGVDISEVNEVMGDTYPADELRKALVLGQIFKEKNISEVDIIAHSEGGINTAIAAEIGLKSGENRIRNIIFVNAGGLIGEDKFPKLAGRFVLSAIQDGLHAAGLPMSQESKRIFRTGHETTKYIAKNPIRALNEAVAISSTEVHEMMRDLHDKGIRIAVINGVDDPVFPMGKMQEIVKVDGIDGFLSVQGGHNEIYVRPEKWIPACDQLLDALELKGEVTENEY